MPGEWLTKSEVNSLYYDAVGGDISFVTEASVGTHPTALARLIARQSARRGTRTIRILELGANNCAFARSLLLQLRKLCVEGHAELDRIDYLAVELARASLEAAAQTEEEVGVLDRVLRPPIRTTVRDGAPEKPTMVALAVQEGPPVVNMGLVHADANQYLGSSNEAFDFVILNELLDDMPYRAYYADLDGNRFEAVPQARTHGDGWEVRVSTRLLGADELPALDPGRLTARSEECVGLVAAIAGLLSPGGMLLLHDYGFAKDDTALADYEPAPRLTPALVTLVFPSGSDHGFPRTFFRVFANENKRVVQVTNDVNFGELTAALEGQGTVILLAHGNAIVNQGATLEKGDGVFLSEFGLLEPDADLGALLAELDATQETLLENFVRERMGGRGSVFLDLVFVKAG